MDQPEELLSDLVAIDSINPDLVPGAAGEAAVAAYIADWLERAGLEVTLEMVAPGRPNVIAVARGSGGGQTLMLNGHIDTVGVAGMERPFAPRSAGGRLYGRGAYDMKCGVAACRVAIASTPRSGREPCAATPRVSISSHAKPLCATISCRSVGSATIAASAR